MKRNFKRNLSIIILVFALALYHVLPTCLYYSRPLNRKIDGREARKIIERFTRQVSDARNDLTLRVAKILSTLKLRGDIKQHPSIPGVVNVHFPLAEDAALFIDNVVHGEPSVPVKSARLYVVGSSEFTGETVVQISGSLVTSLTEKDLSFVSYEDKDITVSQELENLATNLFIESERPCECGYYSLWDSMPIEKVIHVTRNICSGLRLLPARKTQAFLSRCLGTERDFTAFLARLEKALQHEEVKEAREELKDASYLLHSRNSRWNSISPKVVGNVVDCSELSPCFSSMSLTADGKLLFHFDAEVAANRQQLVGNERLDLERLFAMEKQHIATRLNRSVEGTEFGFAVRLRDEAASGKIVLQGHRVCQRIVEHLTALVLNRPIAETCDLSTENFPVYGREPLDSDTLGCFIFSPERSCRHFSKGSVYIVFKGLRSIVAKYEHAGAEEAALLQHDLQNLYACFIHTDAVSCSLGEDRVLEIKEPLQRVIRIWGEEFVQSFGKASLEVRDVRDRLAVVNRIEKTQHAELVRWDEQYRQAQCSMNPQVRLRAAIPHKNIFFENLKLNIRKYSRGEHVLRFGTDFVGGKQIRIAFRDHQGNLLTDKAGIDKVSDELYARLNKLGVSEVGMQREGDHIQVSVPGVAGISSADILGTSKMSFHVVNEQFSSRSPLRYEVQTFLDYLWFTARSLDECSPQAINRLAGALFHGDNGSAPANVRVAVEKLREAGLSFSKELEGGSASLDTQYSMIAIEKESREQVNPLMIVFRNHALEGASLKNIRPEFAVGEGYVLNFGVKDKATFSDGRETPVQQFHAWTSKFCQEGVSGTKNGLFSGGRGWRMAVVLDGYVISDPVLNVPLKDHASVSGNFSYREVHRLAADLKSGAMSFIPEILSEEVVSPELGSSQRVQGILSVVLGLVVLIVLMSVYYRFGGVIASIAVLLNLLLIWASMQYLDAPLTLSGLAGIILAMGMAVDANVLVFERIREEYLLTRSLSESVEAGYKKAFSAIFDSNLTTILASALLLMLDTGPIKGFALTLIIGIFSSMFTALFMTKFFFVIWVQKTRETQLHMMNKFIGIKHNFLKECKRLWVVSGVVLVLGCVGLGFGAWDSVFGMDFKGGYALTLDSHVCEYNPEQMCSVLRKRFQQIGLSSRDYRVRRADSSEKVKIYLSQNALDRVEQIEGAGSEQKGSDYHLARVLQVLSDSGSSTTSMVFDASRGSWFKVSGQLSNKMRTQAVIALFGALGIILLYVSLRFEWRYAFSAICALMHDLLATCAVLVALHFFLQRIQIDLQAIGALMTVLGYSLNNTLIIFDRIREDRREKLFTPMPILINDALQKTLGRTVMTTATTLSVLVILLFVGGGSIFNFAFIMTVGILLGTLSSLYIAPPLLLFMVRKEEQNSLR
ncbi:protein translocase subunit SecDF [Chlamydia trachomatis]|uniref:protein translocase subunit SecDF n=1 Tax=Chlamydia trachomatis TaxID=813 RepID=UPI0001A34FC4|nr:protein translocase subunit SecDF [Chlamydia trachomatis]AHC17297.1 preprotein translocase subunit SecD [Chlamydia trachomatis C/TW-3]APD40127.1 preprotein translocase subunit SecD [Chlamydia trachomatis]CAX10011.1 protein translocase (secFG fusion protein) [Chlamydia trachomatis B/TZ1A828/OT]